MKIGFDNNKDLKMQSEHIRERINQFGDKLYLEFGGKLFDDYHASRVLPGFAPDSKLRMLLQLADQAEIVIVISAADIEKNKVVAALAYIIFFLPLMVCPESPFGKFHANQGLVLLIVGIAGSIVLGFIPIIGWIILPLFSLFLLIIGIIGLVGALNGKAKELPLMGKFKILK